MTNQHSVRSNDALIPAIILFGSLTLLLLAIMPMRTNKPAETTSTVAPTLVAVAATEIPPTEAVPSYDPALVQEGQMIFQTTCTTCHGLDGHGIQGLGKDLIMSEFVASLTDEELLHFIIVGRDASDPLNTTGIPMPARGGNPSLSDEQLMGVVAYMRSISEVSASTMDHSTTASGVAAQPTTLPTAQPTTLPTALPTEEPTAAEPTPVVEAVLPTTIPVTPQSFSAATAYAWSCSGCHGIDGAGNEPFGPSILESDLFEDDADLLAFITEGKPLADPLVEFPHPGRGGFPPLTDEELTQLIDYLHTLVAEQPAS
ncbi:MAG: c-type cytochrome [Chloroflexi bacterium]|nr:c-type cytochrome [Chloroflexota bacterium]MCC6891819.1 c-type cytochrome [Anaerolineae bacterium]